MSDTQSLTSFSEVYDESLLIDSENRQQKRKKFSWQTNYELYTQFKETHNREPKEKEQFEGVKLGGWVSHHREFYKKGFLKKSRIDLLNKAGFVWDPYESEWQTNYELYKQFKEINNREPKEKEQFEEVKLGDWCETQRTAYKREKLEESRLDLLNKAGFVWSIRY